MKDNGTVLNIPPIMTALPKPGLSPLPPPPLTQQELETFKNPPSPYGLAILLVDFSSTFNAIISDLQQDKISQVNMADSTCSCVTDFLSDREKIVKAEKLEVDPSTPVPLKAMTKVPFDPF